MNGNPALKSTTNRSQNRGRLASVGHDTGQPAGWQAQNRTRYKEHARTKLDPQVCRPEVVGHPQKAPYRRTTEDGAATL